MAFADHLPREIAEIIRTELLAQYATVSMAGVPIDTPTVFFNNADGASLDIATGVAYPAKAERARKNPKVGLLIEKGADGPVISIAGLAAVRDADLQANLDRYLSETVLLAGATAMTDWEVTRQAVWYYARLFVHIAPVHVRWWESRAAMEGPPQSWRSASIAPPQSDPLPPGKASAAADWDQPPWQDLASAALARKAPGHLTLLDSEGYPLPIGVRDIRSIDSGFLLNAPAGAPWREGKATLSFQGVEMFVGEVSVAGADLRLNVERALPVFPLAADTSKVLRPDPETRTALLTRLAHEAARRGQSSPVMPKEPPKPTAAALYRVRASAPA